MIESRAGSIFGIMRPVSLLNAAARGFFPFLISFFLFVGSSAWAEPPQSDSTVDSSVVKSDTTVTISDSLIQNSVDNLLDSLTEPTVPTDKDTFDTTIRDSAIDDSTAAVSDSHMTKESLTKTTADSAAREDSAHAATFTDTFYAADTQRDTTKNLSFIVRVGRFLHLHTVFSWLRTHIIHIAILLICAGLIWATIAFFHDTRDKQRFLTRMRLSIMDKEVQKACKYIEKLYYLPHLTPKIVCQDLVTGEAFLQSLFQKELGMSIEEFINHVRINRAKHHLYIHPKTMAAEIAAKVGFEDTDEFERVFALYTDNTTFYEFRDSLADTTHSS